MNARIDAAKTASATSAAARGSSILMCPPDHFGVHYSINPWMSTERPPLPGLARRQWESLAEAFGHAGWHVDTIAPQPGLPDMVFVDAGIVSGDVFVPSNFTFPQRRGEREHFVAWFAARGYRVSEVEPEYAFEGHGDTVWAGDVLYCGHGFRSRPEAHERIRRLLPEVDIVSLELVDPRFYHLDTCFCALDARRALCFPPAFTDAALDELARRLQLIEVTDREAERFACNAVVLGRDVFLPSGTGETCVELRRQGFVPHQVDVSEFIKAGGACKCLAMRI